MSGEDGNGWHEVIRLVEAGQRRIEATTDRLRGAVDTGFRDVRGDIADIREEAAGMLARLAALERWRLGVVAVLGPLLVGVILWQLTGK